MKVVGLTVGQSSAAVNQAVFVRETELIDEEERLAEVDENVSDSVLAGLSANGSEEAFEEILRRYSPRVFRVCGRFFRRQSLIEEAAQDTFLRAFTQLRNFEGRGSLEGWLTRIASTTCINILRTHKRQSELTISDLTENETSWLEDHLSLRATSDHHSDEQRFIAADLVDKVIGSLMPEDAMVLMMMESDGASIREAAAATGWTESKVKVRAFRARRKLREAIEKLIARER